MDTKKVIDIFITVNIVIYAFLTAIVVNGESYRANAKEVKKNTPKIAMNESRTINKALVKEENNIVDPPKINIFPYGQCTWFVASKRNVTWNGNARDWFYNARSAGRKVGKEPIIGAIAVFNEGYYGHVAYVEEVKGGVFTVSEMNIAGWGKESKRSFDKNSAELIGFIY